MDERGETATIFLACDHTETRLAAYLHEDSLDALTACRSCSGMSRIARISFPDGSWLPADASAAATVALVPDRSSGDEPAPEANVVIVLDEPASEPEPVTVAASGVRSYDLDYASPLTHDEAASYSDVFAW